jgi:hemolysin III
VDPLTLREPFSALSHAAGVLLAVPGTILLWRLGESPGRRRAAVTFGICLTFCYAASTHYHAADGPPEWIAFLRRLDHVGIHLLIAGTYTPLAGILLTGRWRRRTLALTWLAAGVGSVVLLAHGVLPTWLSTTVYLGLGWGAVFVYREIGRRHPDRDIRPLLLGGVLYSVGAIINLSGWPAPWPGWIGAHELLHLFVLAGSLTHYTFIAGIVAPGGGVSPGPAWPGVRVQGRHVPPTAPLRKRRSAALQPVSVTDGPRDAAG